MSCIFCAIAAGQIPSTKVFEDASVLAFLDIAPLARGHVLVIPKTHQALLEDLAPAAQTALMSAVGRIARAAREAVGASATTIAINNGRDAGQEVPHCHVHLIPRHAGDGGGPIHALFSRASPPPAKDLTEVARAISARLG